MTTPTPEVVEAVARLDRVLTRCEAGATISASDALLRGLRFDLFRLRRTAQTEFAEVPATPPVQPFHDTARGLCELSDAIDDSMEVHRRAKEQATATRTRMLMDAQLERLRAMARQIRLH